MSRNIRVVNPQWSHADLYHALSACYWSYVRREETEPSVLYCTADLGSLHPHAVCLFAIRSGLRLKFIARDSKAYFYFGD